MSSSDVTTGWSTPGKPNELRSDGAAVLLETGEGALRLDFLARGTVRMRWLPLEKSGGEPSYAVVDRAPLAASALRWVSTPTLWHLTAESVSVEIERSDGRLRFLDHQRNVFLETPAGFGVARSGPKWRQAFVYPDGERTFGLGEKTGRFDRRGSIQRMWNTDTWSYDRLSDPLYQSIPFWVGLRHGRSHGVFVDSHHPLVMDLGARDRHLFLVFSEGGSHDLYVFPGPAPASVLDRFTGLTGRPFLPPRWALGYQVCRYSYYPSERVLSLATELRKRRIPCDVLYLDIHHQDAFKSFTFDQQHFSDPASLIKNLKQLGFRVVVILNPGIKIEAGYEPYESGREGGHFVKTPDGAIATGEVWPGLCAFPDFLAPRTRAWWGDLVVSLVKLGIDGLWVDMNEPTVFGGPGGTLPYDVRHETENGTVQHSTVHNVYGHLMAEATRAGMIRARSDRRPYLLTRAGFAGTHRSAAAWSGDNASSFEDLRLALSMQLNMGVSGQPFFGSDIGGFAGNPSPELYVRWLQVAAFFGVMRTHACAGTPDREPWTFGPEWEPRIRGAIEIRYRLLPYLENAARAANETGTPIMRPLWFEWPSEEGLLPRDDAFLFGPSLLVAPALREGMRWRKVPVPPGRFATFPEGDPLPKRREMTLEAPLDGVPMLVRRGAVIPYPKAQQRASDGLPEVLPVLVYAGGDGTFTLVEDAGDGPPDGPVAARSIAIRWQGTKGPLRLEVDRPRGSGGTVRELEFSVLGLSGPPESVGCASEAATDAFEGGWRFVEAERSLEIRIPVAGLPATFEIDATPREEEPAVLVASPFDGGLLPEDVMALLLQTPRHFCVHDWWDAKPLRAVVTAGWTPEALVIVAEIEHDGTPPTENLQEDGLHVSIKKEGGESVRRYFVGTPVEGGVARELVDRAWTETRLVTGEARDSEGRWFLSLTIAFAALSPMPLAQGQRFHFDLFLQLSDKKRRRGVLEWISGATSPHEPGGLLVLGN